MNLLYSEIFYNFDRSTKNEEGWNEIGDKYGLETKDIEYKSNDNIWLFASFDPGVPHNFNTDEERAVINYKIGMHDDRISGRKAWSDLSDGINNFDKMVSQYPGSFDFYKIFVIAFEDGTDNRLWQFEVEKKFLGKWETTVARYNGDEFKAGVNEQHDGK